MNREIENTNIYSDKLVKIIPGEIIAAFMVINGLIPIDNVNSIWISWVSTIFLAILIPFYLSIIYGVKNKLQIFFTVITFFIWVYWIGGPFTYLNIHVPYIGSILLVIWSLVIFLVFRQEEFYVGQTVKIKDLNSADSIKTKDKFVVLTSDMKKLQGMKAKVTFWDKKYGVVKLDIDKENPWSKVWIEPIEKKERENDTKN